MIVEVAKLSARLPPPTRDSSGVIIGLSIRNGVGVSVGFGIGVMPISGGGVMPISVPGLSIRLPPPPIDGRFICTKPEIVVS